MRRAQPGFDATWFAPRLRPSDAQELFACYPDAQQILAQSIAMSEICDVAEHQGRGVFVIGCAQHAAEPDVGVPWLVGTDEADRFPGVLTKTTRRYIGRFLERWPRLMNHVDARNATSIRWLSRLGFSFGEPVALGAQGEPFLPFSMGA